MKKKFTWLDYSLMVFCLVFWKSYPPQFRKSTPQKLWWKDIVEFSHFQNLKFLAYPSKFFFPLFYFASFFLPKYILIFFSGNFPSTSMLDPTELFNLRTKVTQLLWWILFKKPFFKQLFWQKKNKIEGHGLLSCDDLHEPQNTHKHNKKTFINWKKNGGGDFTTGGEIFNFETLLVKYDY